MKDETMGQEDAAQDAEACAEALESLDRIALDELSFSDSAVDTQDEAHEGTEDEDSDVKDAPDEAEAEAERMADRVEEVFAGEIGRLAEAVVHRDVQGRAQRVDLL